MVLFSTAWRSVFANPSIGTTESLAAFLSCAKSLLVATVAAAAASSPSVAMMPKIKPLTGLKPKFCKLHWLQRAKKMEDLHPASTAKPRYACANTNGWTVWRTWLTGPKTIYPKHRKPRYGCACWMEVLHPHSTWESLYITNIINFDWRANKKIPNTERRFDWRGSNLKPNVGSTDVGLGSTDYMHGNKFMKPLNVGSTDVATNWNRT